MKYLGIAATLILAGVVAYGLAVRTRLTGSVGADPAKVDPKHYEVVLENDSVRILRISYGAGERSVTHYHPDSVAVYLTDGMTRMTTPDGKSQDSSAKAGGAEWFPAGSHLRQHVGSKPFQLLLLELKK